MTLTGAVTAHRGRRHREVAVRGANRLGDHVTGTVTVKGVGE